MWAAHPVKAHRSHACSSDQIRPNGTNVSAIPMDGMDGMASDPATFKGPESCMGFEDTMGHQCCNQRRSKVNKRIRTPRFLLHACCDLRHG